MHLPDVYPKNQSTAVRWGRAGYAVGGISIVGFGCHLLPEARGWINVVLGAILFINVFTYRPRRTDKILGDALGLAWAVVMLCTVPPILVVLMCVYGVRGDTPLLWGTMLASIVGPGYLVWRYFRQRKA